MKKFVNLTQHVLNVQNIDGKIVNIPPSGDVARVSSTAKVVYYINDIAVSKPEYGDVVGLPAPQPGVVYVVSRMIKDRVPDRDDVLVPGAPVRDSDGVIIGAVGLSL
jgi:hypothetical protein